MKKRNSERNDGKQEREKNTKGYIKKEREGGREKGCGSKIQKERMRKTDR